MDNIQAFMPYAAAVGLLGVAFVAFGQRTPSRPGGSSGMMSIVMFGIAGCAALYGMHQFDVIDLPFLK